jgi:Tol biopolymer transport system component
VRNPRQNTVDVWLYDMKGSAGSRFTSGDRTWTGSPVWSPDSSRVLFNEFATAYYVKSVRGGETERWAHGIKSRGGFPRQWSAGTEYIVTIVNDPATLWDIWLLPVSGERKPQPYLASRYTEWMPAISPDGKWIAYASNESGSSEVYINSFPRAGTPQRISLSGGTHPLWRRDGRELFFISADRQLAAASLSVQGSDIAVLERRPLFSMSSVDLSWNERAQYAVLANGEQFLLNVIAGEQPHRNVTVVLNWPALLSK